MTYNVIKIDVKRKFDVTMHLPLRGIGKMSMTLEAWPRPVKVRVVRSDVDFGYLCVFLKYSIVS